MRKDTGAGTGKACVGTGPAWLDWRVLSDRRWKGPKRGPQEHLGVKMISATTGNTSPGSFLQEGKG